MKNTCLSFVLLVSCLSLRAGIDPPAYMLWDNQQLVSGTILSIEDNKWPVMSQMASTSWTFVNHTCQNEITLSLDPFSLDIPGLLEVEVDLKITSLDQTGNSTVVNKAFKINYDPHKGSDYIGKSYYKFNNGYKVNIEIIEIRLNGAVVPNAANMSWLRLEGRIEVDRTYEFDRLLSPAIQQIVQNSNQSKVRIEWMPQSGAESYRLEWTYIPDYHKPTSLSGSPVYQSPDSLVYDFRANSVRVVVTDNFFDLDEVLNHGYYIFRVSAVGRLQTNPSISLEGVWDMDDKGLVSDVLQANPLSVLTVIESHQPLLNWIYTATYAEEGKKSAALTYADGAQNSLQAVARFSDQPTSFVSESILDSRGRPVVQTLPASSETARLDYFPNFNQNSSNIKYSWRDFDPDSIDTKPMNTQSGASKYYSPNNPSQDGPQAFLPDAHGFPFSRVEYDAKGRVSAQGAPGSTHQVEGHATRTWYVSPFQEELNRLFGTEVGIAQRYFKTVVEDPNGQMAISIANLGGQTVATALEGDSPANLDALPSNLGPQALTLNLNSGGRNVYDEETQSMVVDFPFFATSSGNHHLVYSLSGEVFSDSCLSSSFCYDCVYDLIITMVDDSGHNVLPGGPIQLTLQPLDSLDDECNNPLEYNFDESFFLEKGYYIVHKELKLNQAAQDYYRNLYADTVQNTCIRTLSSFISEYQASIDFSGCGKDPCLTDCELKIGSWEEYEALNPGSVLADYQAAIDSCLASCTEPTLCDNLLASMKQEVSPGGKFGRFTLDASGNYTFSDWSLFNTDTQNPLFTLPNGTLHYGNSNLIFLNLDGTPSLINGVAAHLASPTDFVINWQAQWADSLVKLHPQYCMYQWCVLTYESDTFDQALTSMWTLADVPPTWSGNLPQILEDDPYFDVNGPGYSQYASMQTYVTSATAITFLTSTLSLWDFSRMLANCQEGPATTGQQMLTCLQSLTPSDSCTIDKEWQIYRSLYISKKRELIESQIQGLSCYGIEDLLPDSLGVGFSLSIGEALGIDVNQGVSGLQAQMEDSTSAGLAEHCESTCTGYASTWWYQLQDCVPLQDSAAVIDALIAVCMEGCDFAHPFGASTTPGGVTTGGGHNSFAEVLADPAIMGGNILISDPNHPNFNPVCNSFLIPFPRPYESNLNNFEELTSPGLDTCACNAILQQQWDYDNGGTYADSFETFFNWWVYQTGTTIPDIQGIACECKDVYAGLTSQTWTPGSVWPDDAPQVLAQSDALLPGEITCSYCVGCDVVSDYWVQYQWLLDSGHVDVFTAILNDSLGLNLDYWDYATFKDSCDATPDCADTVAVAELIDLFNQLLAAQIWTTDSVTLDSAYHNPLFGDSLCTPLYTATLGGNIEFDDQVLEFEPAPDQGIYVLGLDAASKITLYRKRPDHSIEWKRQLLPSSGTLLTRGIDLLPYEGGVWVAGFGKQANNEEDLVLINLTSAGQVISNNRYAVTGLPRDVLGMYLNQSGHLAVAYTDSVSTRPYTFQTRTLTVLADGTVTGPLRNFPDLGYRAMQPDINHPHFHQFVPAPDSGYYLGGMSDTANALVITRIDPTNSFPVWTRQISLFDKYCSKEGFSFTLESLADSGLAVMIRSRISVSSSWDVWMVRLDADGQEVYARQYDLTSAGLAWEPTAFHLGGYYPPFFSGILTDTLGQKSPVFWPMAAGGDMLPGIIWTPGGPDALLHPQQSGNLDILVDRHEIRHESFDLATFTWLLDSCGWDSMPPPAATFLNLTDSALITLGTFTLTRSNWPVTPGQNPIDDSLVCGPKVMHIALQGTCVDCTVELVLDTPLPIGFDDIISFWGGTLTSPSTFVLYASYQYLGVTDTIAIEGTSDCILPCPWPIPLLCGQPVFPVVNIEPVDDCRQNLLDMAEWQATQAYFQYLDSVSTRFDSLYLADCLQNVQELIELTIPFNQYHHTLYYYDQAGNLVQTVPPSGVQFLDPLLQDDVDAARQAHASTVIVPPHTLTTQYRYNSLNQLIWQKTPDAGEKRYWYDNLGRIVASQDARQSSGGWYAYIRYDALGRTYEAGEIHKPGSPMTELVARDPAQLDGWLNTGSKRQQILTHYDFPLNASINGLFPGGQQELRGRVATVRYVDGEDPNRDHASHYSYDIHGNVSRMIQDFPSLAHLGYQYVPITYDYDLLSGKVNAVHLAPEDPRLEFSHFYTYDADNRIIEVKTSKAGQLSDRDARYFYYDHGPLARTELGAENIQGLDYAYTIQGWIKGVNSDTRKINADMGKDGSYGYFSADPNAHLSFLPDAFGYTLKYFAPDASQTGSVSDYQAIGTQLPFEAANWQTAAQYRSLYNGNIGAMATAIRDTTLAGFPIHLNVYHYDQLNRLTSRQVNRDPNVSANNAWAPVATTDYANAYRYNADGDILGLLRNGHAASGPLEMDSLSYAYKPGTHQLDSVRDAIAPNNYPDDIDSQSKNNYTYDAIGNLISDVSEGISNITWNLDGKIRGVQRTPASARPDLAFWYDAGGNRAVKLVQPTPTEESWRYTYYLRDPQGNTLATLTRGYTPAQAYTGSTLPANATHVETLEVESYELYGASRLGTQQDTTRLRTFAFAGAGFTGLGYFQKSDTVTQAFAAPDAGLAAPYWRGWKSYELSNHLGNVLVTVSDRRTRDQFPNLGQTLSVAAPDVRMAMDYDPFGAVEQGRKLVLTGYRYGFQGQEGDDEMYGEENSLSFKYRVHDVRLGRFLSVDPLSPKYPFYSPYSFSGNIPIRFVELEGLEPSDNGDYDGEIRVAVVNGYANEENNLKYWRWTQAVDSDGGGSWQVTTVNVEITASRQSSRNQATSPLLTDLFGIGLVNNTNEIRPPLMLTEEGKQRYINEYKRSAIVDNERIASTGGTSGIDGGRFGCTRYENGNTCGGVLGRKYHDGTDVEAAVGNPVSSALAGTVTAIQWIYEENANGDDGYGNYVEVTTDGLSGSIVLRYNHLNGVSVMVGDLVDSGSIIGTTGATGNAFDVDNKHVHVRARLGGLGVNPERFLKTKFDENGQPIP